MSFYGDLWRKRRPAGIIRLTCLTWYDQVTSLERQQSAHVRLKLQLTACLDSAVCHWAWRAVGERSLELCVCARASKEKKENGREGESVCVRSPTWLFVSVWNRGESSWGDISSAVWLSQFPREAVSRTMQKKNHQPQTIEMPQKKVEEKKKSGLFVGDWIIAVAWDWRQGKCVSDCTVLVPDTYHLPDSSTHPSPSAPHNNRNTLEKRESEGKGTQDKYCVSIFPPSPLQLSFTLTDEQWKYFELCCVLSFTSGVQNRAVKARRVLAEIDWFAFYAPCLPFVPPRKLWFLSSTPDVL